jgi:spermidine synthase
VYTGFVPTYPGVFWSYTTGTAGEPLSVTNEADVARRLASRGIPTRFYTAAMHAKAFALPAFVTEAVGG